MTLNYLNKKNSSLNHRLGPIIFNYVVNSKENLLQQYKLLNLRRGRSKTDRNICSHVEIRENISCALFVDNLSGCFRF